MGLMKHVRDRWTIENFWHLPRDTQLREDAHRYRETNGVQIMATLGRLAMNALRLDGFWSITEGLAATEPIRPSSLLQSSLTLLLAAVEPLELKQGKAILGLDGTA